MARSTAIIKTLSLQAHNITDEQVAKGIRDKEVNRMKVYHDFNGDAGGYVKKDAIWWYGSIASSTPRSTNRASR